MNKVIVSMLLVYFFLSCIPSLTALSSASEGTILPFFAMFVVFLWWCYFCVSEKIRFTMMDALLGLYIVACVIPLLLYPDTPKEDWLALGTTIQLVFMFIVARVMLTNHHRSGSHLPIAARPGPSSPTGQSQTSGLHQRRAGRYLPAARSRR